MSAPFMTLMSPTIGTMTLELNLTDVEVSTTRSALNSAKNSQVNYDGFDMLLGKVFTVIYIIVIVFLISLNIWFIRTQRRRKTRKISASDHNQLVSRYYDV